ncbi:MAG: hypothetical protein J6J11_04185 [Treponema sp.]|nr:hypothetical protein [Treponema sp.]
MSENKFESSFFQKFFNSLFRSNDPEAEKKRQLKSIAKNLSHMGYKFYKSGSDQIQPQFGKFFFDMYKIVSQAQLFFQTQQNPNFYKNMVVEYSLSEKQKQLIENLTEETIQNVSRNVPFNELKTKIKNDLENFIAEFDMDKVNKIDGLYTKLLCFKSFCLYDFYFMLKKFDSSIREGEFNRSPKFEPIDAAYIADDLKDFLSIVYSMPLEESWDDLMLMFKTVKGVEPVKPNQWNKIVSKLKQLCNHRIFDMIIQIITKDPSYVTDVSEKKERVVEAYIESIRSQASSTLKKLESEQKNSKIDSLLVQIFNTSSVSILKNYTEQGSAAFEKKELGGYEYARPLNYLKAFLVEFVKRDIREYADLVIIRGKWTTAPLSSQMSEDYHVMLEMSDAITAFDDKHAEEAEIGIKLKTLLPRAERDKDSGNIIRTLLKDSNEQAREYLIECTRVMISFAKTLKMLIEDYQKPRGEIVMNWKELDHFAEHPIQQLSVEVYKKIYLFVNLMQGFLQN